MTRLPDRPLFALGAAIPLALVAFAIVLTQFYQVAACPLCIVQRMLYIAIAMSSFTALISSHRIIHIVAASLAVAFSACGTAIAGYQIYLQRNPFTATCGDGTSWWELLVDQAGLALPLLFKAGGFCSDTAWSFGLSIVEWSLLSFGGLSILFLYLLLLRCFARSTTSG